MTLEWADERYVRWYTRDTPEWCALSWQARGLFGLLLRAVDRAGVLPVGKLGQKGVAVATRATWVEIEPYVVELVADGCVRFDGERMVIPNFLAAQETRVSDKARAKEYRERRRDGIVTTQEKPSRSVTDSGAPVLKPSHDVTQNHTASHDVTPSLSVPCLSEPNQTNPPKPPPPVSGVSVSTGHWPEAEPTDESARLYCLRVDWAKAHEGRRGPLARLPSENHEQNHALESLWADAKAHEVAWLEYPAALRKMLGAWWEETDPKYVTDRPASLATWIERDRRVAEQEQHDGVARPRARRGGGEPVRMFGGGR